MLRLIYVTLCLAGMLGFYLFLHYLIYNSSNDFVNGFGVGFGLFLLLLYLAERVGGITFHDTSNGVWIPFDKKDD